jgi:hypothetical protein
MDSANSFYFITARGRNHKKGPTIMLIEGLGRVRPVSKIIENRGSQEAGGALS